MAKVLKGMIRLADNPDYDDDDEDKYQEEYEDNSGTEGDNDNDMEDETVEKGIPVKGPRTKVKPGGSNERLEAIEKSIATIASANSVIAKGQRYILKHIMNDDEDDDMGMSGDNNSDAGMDDEGYDEDQDPMNDLSDENGQEDDHRLDLSRRTNKARTVKKSKISKDDAASSFGEKDNNTPGNRPFDPTDTEEDDTVIQGGRDAGPGPISKALDAKIAKAVEARIAEYVKESSTVMKATGAGIGTQSGAAMDTQLSKAEYDDLNKNARNASFSELNRLRTEMGMLSAGPL